jgi:predicted Fe-Mo cluster-binding NifX family protein
MDDKEQEYKIAVASSDGIVVNQHFGHADTFFIYEINGEEFRKTDDIRRVEPVCNGGNHDDAKLLGNMGLFKDCKYIIVSRIGTYAAMQAEKLGIRTMELPGFIEESIRKLIAFEQIQNLFEGN